MWPREDAGNYFQLSKSTTRGRFDITKIKNVQKNSENLNG